MSDRRADLAYLGWKADPEKTRRALLDTRLSGLTVRELLDILEALDEGDYLRGRGLVR